MSSESVLPLCVGGSWVALEATSVREVLGRTVVTRVPGATGGLVGVLPWRGRAVAVLDLATVLGEAPLDRSRARTLIVARGEDLVALPVDRVREAAVAETARAAHVAKVPYANREVELAGETFPLIDLSDWLDALNERSA